MASMYFIAIVLPSHINEKIIPYKNRMMEKHGCRVGLKSPAHITLIAPFWMDESQEEQLKNDVQQISNHFSPFSIITKDFSSFRPKTIFIATENNELLNEIREQTNLFFKDKPEYKISIDSRQFHPHITIATRDLHKKSFKEAWQYFETQTFKEDCMITGISILRHNQKNWDVIYTSQFKSF